MLGYRPFALAVALAAIAPTVAHSAPSRVPAGLSQEESDALTSVTEAMSPELLAAFRAVAVDAVSRRRASERSAAEGKGDVLTFEQAARAASIAADFGGLSKRKGKAIDVLVPFVVLQVTADLHHALRDKVARRLAIRSVRACNGEASCLDAIAPTSDMSAQHLAVVRVEFASRSNDLDSAEQVVTVEIQSLSKEIQSERHPRPLTSDKQRAAMEAYIKG